MIVEKPITLLQATISGPADKFEHKRDANKLENVIFSKVGNYTSMLLSEYFFPLYFLFLPPPHTLSRLYKKQKRLRGEENEDRTLLPFRPGRLRHSPPPTSQPCQQCPIHPTHVGSFPPKNHALHDRENRWRTCTEIITDIIRIKNMITKIIIIMNYYEL